MFDVIGFIVIRLAVVAFQMMRGQPAPQIFFPRTAPGYAAGNVVPTLCLSRCILSNTLFSDGFTK